MNQIEVYEVHFPFPNTVTSPHPVLILSIPTVIECEGTFIGVPISHSAAWANNEFSFPIYDTDFDAALLYADSFIRMHLITVIRKTDLVNGRRLRVMKQASFNNLWDEIQQLVFGCY